MGIAVAGGTDRVRRNTADAVNAAIDRETLARIMPYANQGASRISARIRELDAEWDVERWLETNASTIAFTGLILGLTVNKKWMLVPGIVLPFLFQHAVQGWCPPIPALRRLGIRTREEIDLEKYALKALRGDFKETTPHNPNAAFAAANA
jgi:hypothetical protein